MLSGFASVRRIWCRCILHEQHRGGGELKSPRVLTSEIQPTGRRYHCRRGRGRSTGPLAWYLPTLSFVCSRTEEGSRSPSRMLLRPQRDSSRPLPLPFLPHRRGLGLGLCVQPQFPSLLSDSHDPLFKQLPSTLLDTQICGRAWPHCVVSVGTTVYTMCLA